MTNEQINEIAGELDCGLRCFIHKEKGTVVSIPDELNNPGMDTDAWSEAMEEIDNEFDSYVEVEKMDSHESFRVMEDFVETITDVRLRDKLERALSRPKQFRNFKYEIDNSGPYREEWFAFKNQRLFEWVKDQIIAKGL
jgi:hypothetical protein